MDADPEKMLISVESDLGKALMGKKLEMWLKWMRQVKIYSRSIRNYIIIC